MRPDPVQDPMLVLCPIGQEGHVNGELLRDRGLPVRVIDGFAISGGYAETGGLLVAEEAFDRFDPQPLFSWLETQPPWPQRQGGHPMWKITILGDRHDGADKLHEEHFNGNQQEAAEQATILLDQHGGLRADVDPV